jgi:hypothetical protein
MAGNHVFVDDLNGIDVFDLANPHIPKPAGSYEGPGDRHSLTVVGDYVYFIAETEMFTPEAKAELVILRINVSRKTNDL